MKTKYLIIIGIVLIVAITVYLFWDDIKSFFAPKDSNREADVNINQSPGNTSGSTSGNSTSPLAPNPVVQYSNLKVGDILVATKSRSAYSASPNTSGVKKYAGVFNKGSYIGVVQQTAGGVLKVRNYSSGPYSDTWGEGDRVVDFYVVPGEYQVKR